MTRSTTQKPTRVRSLSTIVVGLALVSMGSHAAGVKPGYWETTSRVLSPIHTSSTEQRCVTQEQVRKFMSCYINHHYECTCAEDVVGGGKVAFRGVCVDHHSGAKVGVVGAGTYTDTTLAMSADASFRMLGLPVTAKATIDAKRLSDTCPAEPR